MHLGKSGTVELKQTVVDDIKKELIAFANSDGGRLFIGVSDTGDVVGLEGADGALLRITNMVRDAIKPDVTRFLHYEVQAIDGKRIVAIEVQRGTQRPYFLGQKGLRPEGVYVRQGTSAVSASDTAIRRMIQDTDGDSFVALRALNQELTFAKSTVSFAERAVTFSAPQRKTLGLVNRDGIYTNLGLLLSDQCVHTIKAATFEGTGQAVFRDRREFGGSLLWRLSNVYEYIDLRNQTHARFDKLLRVDFRDYPEAAIREALLNSLVHRDYAYGASTIISIYEDRLELVSIGGLLPGIGLSDMMLGLSVCRNPKLANVFYRLQLIEAYGTGLHKIMSAYEGSEKKPGIEVTDNAFKIVLPNRNAASSTTGGQSTEAGMLLRLAEERGGITRRDVEELLNIGQSTAGRLLRLMSEKGLLHIQGRGKNIRYMLNRQK